MKVYRNTLGGLLLVWAVPPLVLAAVAIAFGVIVSPTTYKAVETYYGVALGMVMGAVALMLVSASLMTVDLRRGVDRKFRYHAFIPAVVLLAVATVMFGMVFHTVNSDAAYGDAYNYAIAMLALSAVTTVYGLVPTIIIALVHSGKVPYVNQNELQARITDRVRPLPVHRSASSASIRAPYGGSAPPPPARQRSSLSANAPPVAYSYSYGSPVAPLY
jgi:hypothetical protein